MSELPTFACGCSVEQLTYSNRITWCDAHKSTRVAYINLPDDKPVEVSND